MENLINEVQKATKYLNKKRNNHNLLSNITTIGKTIIKEPKGINKIKHNDLIKLIIEFMNLSELCSLIYHLGYNKLSIIIYKKLISFIQNNLHFNKIKESGISNKITISTYSSKFLLNEFFQHLKIKKSIKNDSKYFYYDSEYEKSYKLISNHIYINDNLKYNLPDKDYYSHFQILGKKRNIIVFFSIKKILFFNLDNKEEIHSCHFKGEYIIYYEEKKFYIIPSYINGSVYFFNINKNEFYIKDFFKIQIEVINLSEIDNNLICFFSPNKKDDNGIIIYNIDNEKIEKQFSRKIINIFVIKNLYSIALIDEEKIEYYSLKTFQTEKIFLFSNINLSNINVLSFISDLFPFGNCFIISGDVKNIKAYYLFIQFNNFKNCLFKFSKTEHTINNNEFIFLKIKKKKEKYKIIFYYSDLEIKKTKKLKMFTYDLDNIKYIY